MFWINILLIYILQLNSEMLRENLERMAGTDDSAFSGIDLATLIRNKYGRSYDVQLIKKVGFLYLKIAMLSLCSLSWTLGIFHAIPSLIIFFLTYQKKEKEKKKAMSLVNL